MKHNELREAKTVNRYGGKRTTVSVGIGDHEVLLEFDDDDRRITHGLDRNTATFVAEALLRAVEEIDYEISCMAAEDDCEEEEDNDD